MKNKKPKWWVKPLVDNIHHGCLYCGGTATILDMKTRLYNGFGGWHILKDKKIFFWEEDSDKSFDKCKQLKDIEKSARRQPNCDWRAIFDLALRGGKYQRYRGKWYLIESNQGFA